MEKHAIFIDIDGTLTVGYHIVPERVREAIAKARERGHLVFINTGRSWGNIPDTLLDTLEVDGWLAGNGTHVVVGNRLLLHKTMPTELVRRVAQYFLDNKNLWCILEGEKSVYYIPSPERIPLDYQKLITDSGELEKALESNRIEVIAAGPKVPKDFIELFKDELTIFPFPSYVDCVMKGCTKANAMRVALEETGVERKNTIAVGDSSNDIPMLKYAAIGVAMGNAQPEVFEIADDVTATNEECGVAAVIEKYLL